MNLNASTKTKIVKTEVQIKDKLQLTKTYNMQNITNIKHGKSIKCRKLES